MSKLTDKQTEKYSRQIIIKKIGIKILKDLEDNGCKIIGDNKIKKIPHAAITMEDAMSFGRLYKSGEKITLKILRINSAVVSLGGGAFVNKMIRKEVAAILRDIWIKRSIWTS